MGTVNLTTSGTCGIIGGMTTAFDSPDYTGYRFPAEIISHAVWLYFRFSLSYRDVEELMAARGIVLTYETVRQWCRKFGQQKIPINRPVSANEQCADSNHRATPNAFWLPTAPSVSTFVPAGIAFPQSGTVPCSRNSLRSGRR
jgi:putative transposase